MYRSALPLLLLSGLILWFLLSRNSEEAQPEVNPSQEVQQSDPSSQFDGPKLGASNLDRIEEEPTPGPAPEVREKSSTVQVLWRAQAPLSGYLLDNDDRQWFFNRERGAYAPFSLNVPPGSYSVQLENGASAWPHRFQIMDDPVLVRCVPGAAGYLALTEDGIPVAGATVFGEGAREEGWVELGLTNALGHLDFVRPQAIRRLMFFKKRTFMVMYTKIGSLADADPRTTFDVGGRHNAILNVVSSTNGEGIPLAQIQLMDFPLERADINGRFVASTKENSLSNHFKASADGMLDSAYVIPNVEADSNEFICHLQPLAGLVAQVVSEDGIPVPGARVFIPTPRAEAYGTPLWSGEADAEGKFFLAEGTGEQEVLYAWDETFGLGSVAVAEAMEEGVVRLTPQPPLIFQLNPEHPEGTEFSSMTADSFWDDSLQIERLDDGRVSIPGALAARWIRFTLNTGQEYKTRRVGSFQYEHSLFDSNAPTSLCGNIMVEPIGSHELHGKMKGLPEVAFDQPLLEVRLSPGIARVRENMKRWPNARGQHPTGLDGWVWDEINVRARAIPNEDGSFSFSGLAESDFRISLHDINNNSAKVNFSGPTEILIPATEELVLNLQETIALDWELYSLAAPERKIRPLIQWSETDQLDHQDMRTMPFGSTFIQWAFPGKPTSTVRLVVPGFHPQTLLIKANESGVDQRRINLEPTESMRIHLDDQRAKKSDIEIFLGSRPTMQAFDDSYPGENQLHAHLGEQTELDYFGLYPNAGIGIFGGSRKVNMTPNRFLFQPGGEITIVISDEVK